MEQVRHIVSNSIGLNSKRGDSIHVAALIAATPASNKVTQQTVVIPSTTNTSSTLIYALLLVLLAVSSIGYRLMQRHKRRLLLNQLTEWLSHHE